MVAIILCGVPIVLEAMIGLVTAFDIKADVLVSLALVASVCIEKTLLPVKSLLLCNLALCLKK